MSETRNRAEGAARINVTVGPAPSKNREAVLGLVLSSYPAEHRFAQVASLLAAGSQGRVSFAGLLEATCESGLTGAAWVQLQPGRVANVWPPQLVSKQPDSDDSLATAHLLERAVDQFLLAAPVDVAHALLPVGDEVSAERMGNMNFRHSANLVTLESLVIDFPKSAPAGEMKFVPFKESDADRLATVLERTYVGSLDCPAIDGCRQTSDTIRGYRHTGDSDTGHWHLITRGGQEIGCLLLAEHKNAKVWELVYMGIVPEKRGCGFGLQAVMFAQWYIRHHQGTRVILAVDEQNSPGQKMYSRANFRLIDRRAVWLRVFERST